MGGKIKNVTKSAFYPLSDVRPSLPRHADLLDVTNQLTIEKIGEFRKKLAKLELLNLLRS